MGNLCLYRFNCIKHEHTEEAYMTSMGNGQEEDFFAYAQGFRVNAAWTAASIANHYT